MIRIALLTLAAIAALSACGGGGEEEEPGATTPAGETAAPEGSTPADATTLPEITNLCELVTREEVEKVLGVSLARVDEVVGGSCNYGTAFGVVGIERGSQRDFEVGVNRDGDLGEPVPGIGDEAAWWGGGFLGAGILSVRQGDFYFRVFPSEEPGGEDSAAQLEVAKDIAAKAVERIP